MDQKYVTLFREIARTTSILAEQVMEFNRNSGDKKGEETAQLMRDDFNSLYDRMNVDIFNPHLLTIDDYRRLLVGALIVVNNLNNKIENEQKAVQNYNLTIIPQLQRILNECKDQDSVNTLADEIFKINT